jgi:hypothetical protein
MNQSNEKEEQEIHAPEVVVVKERYILVFSRMARVMPLLLV